MLDVNKIRLDFPMLENNKVMQGYNMVYFDNANTTFKPICVMEAEMEYYTHYSCNSHRGDYDLAERADKAYEDARIVVSKFINAKANEVVFTSGTSFGLNMIAQGLKNKLSKGDEIIISEAEHASNVLPWFRLQEEVGCVVKFVPLTKEGRITPSNLKSVITSKTKIVSLAYVTNVLGYVLDIKELAKITHEQGAIFVCDGAQATPHLSVDVKDLDVDFFVFSGHKCLGPTGTGVMYGKIELLNEMPSMVLGGGMNTTFKTCGTYGYLASPQKFEAGTQNIAGAIGLARAIKYLEDLGMDNISSYEHELKKYAVSKLKEIPEIIMYNETSESGIITFNYKGVHAQDMATLLASYGICTRSGEHCAKLLPEHLGELATVRASFYFYNTKEEIDQFVEACKKGCDFLDVFFA